MRSTSEAMKKNAPIIQLDKIASDERFVRAETDIFELLQGYLVAQKDIEHRMMSRDLSVPILDLLYGNTKAEPYDFTEIRTRPCCQTALKRHWYRDFGPNDFLVSYAKLASSLSENKIEPRVENAVAIARNTNIVTTKYPAPDKLPRLVKFCQSLVEKPVIPELPLASGIIAMIYLYRSHLLADCNGRSSRAMLNIAYRNFGLLTDEPKVFIGPIFMKYLRVLGPTIRGRRGHIQEVIMMVLLMIKKSLQLNSV